MAKSKFLIYGAYGYTGELITELAVKKGHQPILAGRNEEKTKALADKFNLPYLVFDLSEAEQLDAALQQVGAVLHIAGPFSATAQTMVNACLKNKVHYLDVTGEIEVFEWVASQDAVAKEAGIVLMSGVGFDVVPSDCLANHLKNQMPDATHLSLVIKAIGELSRGTTLTMLENIHKGGTIRKHGKLKQVSATYRTREVPFQSGTIKAISIAWGDVATAYHSTKIPNITTYFAVDLKTHAALFFSNYFGWFLSFSFMQNFLKAQVNRTVTGPSETHREKSKSYIWGEVRNEKGEIRTAELETPEGYKLTAETALESVLRVLKSDLKGYYTPAMAFGADYILEFEGVKRIEN